MASVLPETRRKHLVSLEFANQALRYSAGAWFALAIAGQLIFAYYLVALYGRGVVRGDLSVLGKVMPHGYVAGDTAGNLVVAAHVLLAIVIILGGAVQVIPQIRNTWPVFHRWTGRIYALTVAAVALLGLYMVWFRGAVGDLSQHVGISLDAVLILAFVYFAVRAARGRKFAEHRKWALRLFMAASAVWFFRITLMLWIVANQGPAGFDPDTFTGPFLTFLSFADYLIPLAILQLYFFARERGSAVTRLVVSFVIGVATFATLIGVAAATMLMWLPRT